MPPLKRRTRYRLTNCGPRKQVTRFGVKQAEYYETHRFSLHKTVALWNSGKYLAYRNHFMQFRIITAISPPG